MKRFSEINNVSTAMERKMLRINQILVGPYNQNRIYMALIDNDNDCFDAL